MKAYHQSMCKKHLLHLVWDPKIVRRTQMTAFGSKVWLCSSLLKQLKEINNVQKQKDIICQHHCLSSSTWYFIPNNNMWVSVWEHNHHDPLRKLHWLSSGILMLLFLKYFKELCEWSSICVESNFIIPRAFLDVSLFSLLGVCSATLCNRLCWNTGRNNCSTQKMSV